MSGVKRSACSNAESSLPLKNNVRKRERQPPSPARPAFQHAQRVARKSRTAPARGTQVHRGARRACALAALPRRGAAAARNFTRGRRWWACARQ